MSRKVSRKVSDDYAPFFPGWARVGHEFQRSLGDWRQVISFGPLRGSHSYVPQCSFDYALAPGTTSTGFLPQLLACRSVLGVGVNYFEREHPTIAAGIAQEMFRQFKPDLREPLSLHGIRRSLQEHSDSRAHVYGLCLTAIEAGESEAALVHLTRYRSLIKGNPSPYFGQAIGILERCLAL